MKTIEKMKYKTAEQIRSFSQFSDEIFQLHNRRYIGNKFRLTDWIFSIIDQECEGRSFVDIFAGTGVVAAAAKQRFSHLVLNDFLYSNNVIYRAFFENGDIDYNKIINLIKEFNDLNTRDLCDNYFSRHFGGKYFSRSTAKKIGFIRENIEKNKEHLTLKEYYVLIASLIYSADKIANTVGHYDAYFKRKRIRDSFFMKPIEPISVRSVEIFREDANSLVNQITADIAYIDPPYNSRQYSRFYHVLENLAKWEKPKLYGVALKPEPENMSDYCRVSAKHRLMSLVNDMNVKYLVVSYNNTYNSKSNSSQNKITLKEIQNILKRRGKTKMFAKDYRHFNAGNTDFKDHKEYLFVTKVEYAR